MLQVRVCAECGQTALCEVDSCLSCDGVKFYEQIVFESEKVSGGADNIGGIMSKDTREEGLSWRNEIRIDNEGKEYLLHRPAAAFLDMAPGTLSNKLQNETGPQVVKQNGKNRFYLSDLKKYDEGRKIIKADTNWHRLKTKRSA